MAGPNSIGTIGTGREGYVGIVKETVFGCQEPAPATFLEFVTESLKNNEEKLESNANIGSRIMKDIYQGVQDINGGTTHEINPDNIGLLIAAAMGKEVFAVDTPETGAHTHTFTPAAPQTTLQSLQLDIGRAVRDYRYNGCRVNSMKFSAVLHSILTADFEYVGRSEVANVAEIHSITMVADVAGSLGGKFFYIDAPDPTGGVTEYYVWYDVDAGSTDPAPVSRTGAKTAPTAIEIDITTGDSATVIAAATETVMDAVSTSTIFTTTATSGVLQVTYQNTGAGSAEDSDTLFTFAATQFTTPTFSTNKPWIYTQGTITIDGVLAAFVREMEYTYNNNIFTDGYTLDGTRHRNAIYEQALDITGNIKGEWTDTSAQQRIKYTRNQDVKIVLDFVQDVKIGSTNTKFSKKHTINVSKFMTGDNNIGGPDAIDFSLDFKAIKPGALDPLSIELINGVGTAYIT